MATTYSARNATSSLDLCPIDLVRPSALNPRKAFDAGKLAELAESIAQHGLLEPIVVRERDGEAVRHPEPGYGSTIVDYEIVAGERRYRACLLAGLTEVPVRNLGRIDDRTALELALIENLQRVDLDPIEEAEGYRQLNRIVGKTQAEIAQAVHRSQPAVANAIRLLDLPEDVQGRIRAGELSVSHGLGLVRWKDYPEFVSGVAAIAAKDTLTSKALEAIRPDDYRLTGARFSLYNAPFEAAGCEDCSFGARWQPEGNTNQYQIYCLKPSHYRQLEREHAAAMARANAALVAETTAAATAGAIPTVADLQKRGHIERLSSYRGTPSGCSAECKCRAKARETDGREVAVCLDPKRMEKLRGADTRAAGQQKRAAMVAKSAKAIAAAGDAHTPRTLLLAVLVGKALGGYSIDKTKRIQAILNALDLRLDAKALLGHSAGPNLPYAELIGLAEGELLRLGAQVILGEDVWMQFEQYGSGRLADWFLRHARQDRLDDAAGDAGGEGVADGEPG